MKREEERKAGEEGEVEEWMEEGEERRGDGGGGGEKRGWRRGRGEEGMEEEEGEGEEGMEDGEGGRGDGGRRRGEEGDQRWKEEGDGVGGGERGRWGRSRRGRWGRGVERQYEVTRLLTWHFTPCDSHVTCSYLGDGKDDISGGGEGAYFASELVPHNLGEHHADGLSQHDGLRLNPSHTCEQPGQKGRYQL